MRLLKALITIVLILMICIPVICKELVENARKHGVELKSLPKQTYAYLSYYDGTIEQYKVTPNGKFIPLSPAIVHTGEEMSVSRVAIDPSERFAYAVAGDDVYQFKIKQNGTLQLLKSEFISKGKNPVSVVVDNTGNFVYVILNHFKSGDIAQYRINKDGTLSPLVPATVPAGLAAACAAIHPTKPIIYVTNMSDGTISQYVIGKEGTLSPMNPPVIKMGGSPGKIVLSKDGKYAYIVDVRGQTILLLGINCDGSLVLLSGASYGSEDDPCCGNVTITLGPSGSVFLSDGMGNSLYEFKVTSRQIIKRVEDYKLTRDNNIKTRKETYASVRQNRAKLGKEEPSPDDDIDALNDLNYDLGSASGEPYTVEFSPDGMFYVVNSSGVARFEIEQNTVQNQVKGKQPKKNAVLPDIIKNGEPAKTWPDKVAEKERKFRDKIVDTDTHNAVFDGLVFFTR